MKAKLPIIGEIRTGKDIAKRGRPPKTQEKLSTSGLGAGFLDFSEKALSGDKSVSDKLIKSFLSWVYINVHKIAKETSKIEFELSKVIVVRDQMEFKEVTTHPLLDLLDKPNPFTTTSQLLYLTSAHIQLTGDAFWLLDKPNQPTKAFVLQPDKVEVTPGDQRKGYLIEKYTYKDVIDGKPVETIYAPELILHFKSPNPGNPYRGKSKVEAAALSIDISELSRTFLKMFFVNGAVPNFALSSDQRITDDDIKRISAQLKQSYGGVRNAFKTMILGGGLKPVTVQQTGQQMQLLELLTAMRDEIMAMFENTKASLGITEDVNRANAESSILTWKETTVRSEYTLITDTINEFLVPKFATGLVLGFEDPVPENKEQKITDVSNLFKADIISQNEAREELGYDTVDGGDEFSRQRTERMAKENPQPQVPKSLAHINLKKHMRTNGIYEYVDTQKNMYAAAKMVARKMIKPKKKQEPLSDGKLAAREYANFTFEEATNYWAKQIQITEVREKRFTDKISKFLEDLEEKAVSNLHSQMQKKVKAFDLFDVDTEKQASIDLFTPLAIEIAELSASEAYQLLSLSTVYNPSKSLKSHINKAVAEFTDSFLDTDKDKLSSILEEGIKQGKSVPQIERDIREQFGEFRKNQSTKIARTEILRYSNTGQLDAFKESGVVSGKQWYTARDGRVDAECAALDGKIINLESDFFETKYGSGQQPPLHPNCRCVLLPVIKNDKSAEADILKEENDKLKTELSDKDEMIKALEKLVE